MAKARNTPQKISLTYGQGPKILPGQTVPDYVGPAYLAANAWLEANVEIFVESSNVVGIRYDLDNLVLVVSFLPSKSSPSGSVYEYTDVPPETARDMYNASSMGSFVHQRLKDRYPVRRVK